MEAIKEWRRRQDQFNRRQYTEGIIYSYTIIRTGHDARFQKQTPIILAIVEVALNKYITAQITDTDHDKIKLGQHVERVFRILFEDGDRGIIAYGDKFRPKLFQQET